MFYYFLVEKEWACPCILYYSVPGYDLVLFIVHSVRPRFSEENCFYLHGIKKNKQ